jgi:hypothetical protein
MPNYVYGDACVTGDDKYVIAQFRSDARMDWVAELRAFLVKDELKYKYFQPERHRVHANKLLWSRVTEGVHAAEITVLDPFEYEAMVRYDLESRGAEFGYDYDDRMLKDMVGDAIIEDSPLGAAMYAEYDWLSDNTSRSEVRNSFQPAAIKRRVGGKLKHAVLTAARAHAMVSPSEKQDLIYMCSGLMMPSPARQLAIIKRMARIFDVEHAGSVKVLNEFTDRMAHASNLRHTFRPGSDGQRSHLWQHYASASGGYGCRMGGGYADS